MTHALLSTTGKHDPLPRWILKSFIILVLLIGGHQTATSQHRISILDSKADVLYKDRYLMLITDSTVNYCPYCNKYHGLTYCEVTCPYGDDIYPNKCGMRHFLGECDAKGIDHARYFLDLSADEPTPLEEHTYCRYAVYFNPNMSQNVPKFRGFGDTILQKPFRPRLFADGTPITEIAKIVSRTGSIFACKIRYDPNSDEIAKVIDRGEELDPGEIHFYLVP